MRIRLLILAGVTTVLAFAALAHASQFISIYTIAGPKQLQGPAGLAAAPDGTVFIADTINQRIERLAPTGQLTTIAGTGDNGFSGDGGPALQAKFEDPTALALAADGSLYVCDTGNNRIRVIRPDGTVATVAGVADQGFSGDGGPATSAQLNTPTGIAVDPQGRIFFSDTGNNRIREIGPNGRIQTVVADPLSSPTGLAIAPDGSLLIADTGNNAVRRFTADSGVTTVSNGLEMPVDVAQAPDGSVYVAEQRRNRVSRVVPGGIPSPFAGPGAPRFGGDGNAASTAYLNAPHALELLKSGQELVVADSDNDRVRYISSSDHASRLAVAAPTPSLVAALRKKQIVVKKRKRRILIVRDIPIPMRLSQPAKLTLTIRTKKGRFVATLQRAGGPDLVAVRLPSRLRSGKHRLAKDHYVVGVTAKSGSATAATSLELIVR